MLAVEQSFDGACGPELRVQIHACGISAPSEGQARVVAAVGVCLDSPKNVVVAGVHMFAHHTGGHVRELAPRK